MPRKQTDVERALQKKGFKQSESHHRFFVYYSKGGQKTAVNTKTSHGHSEVSDDLLSKMARQLKLNRGEFLDLVDCPLSRDEYEKKLVALNLVAAA